MGVVRLLAGGAEAGLRGQDSGPEQFGSQVVHGVVHGAPATAVRHGAFTARDPQEGATDAHSKGIPHNSTNAAEV
jgi:hypothetical protein